MNTFLRINKTEIEPLIQELNELLANYHIYYQNLRNFHWNVTGPHFFELHRQFELAYNESKIHIDEIAERILMLGFRPVSKWSEYIYISEIKEPTDVYSAEEMMTCTLQDTRQLIYKLNLAIDQAEKAHDQGTADLLTGFLKAFEKRNWQYQAFQKAHSLIK